MANRRPVSKRHRVKASCRKLCFLVQRQDERTERRAPGEPESAQRRIPIPIAGPGMSERGVRGLRGGGCGPSKPSRTPQRPRSHAQSGMPSRSNEEVMMSKMKRKYPGYGSGPSATEAGVDLLQGGHARAGQAARRHIRQPATQEAGARSNRPRLSPRHAAQHAGDAVTSRRPSRRLSDVDAIQPVEGSASRRSSWQLSQQHAAQHAGDAVTSRRPSRRPSDVDAIQPVEGSASRRSSWRPSQQPSPQAAQSGTTPKRSSPDNRQGLAQRGVAGSLRGGCLSRDEEEEEEEGDEQPSRIAARTGRLWSAGEASAESERRQRVIDDKRRAAVQDDQGPRVNAKRCWSDPEAVEQTRLADQRGEAEETEARPMSRARTLCYKPTSLICFCSPCVPGSRVQPGQKWHWKSQSREPPPIDTCIRKHADLTALAPARNSTRRMESQRADCSGTVIRRKPVAIPATTGEPDQLPDSAGSSRLSQNVHEIEISIAGRPRLPDAQVESPAPAPAAQRSQLSGSAESFSLWQDVDEISIADHRRSADAQPLRSCFSASSSGGSSLDGHAPQEHSIAGLGQAMTSDAPGQQQWRKASKIARSASSTPPQALHGPEDPQDSTAAGGRSSFVDIITNAQKSFSGRYEERTDSGKRSGVYLDGLCRDSKNLQTCHKHGLEADADGEFKRQAQKCREPEAHPNQRGGQDQSEFQHQKASVWTRWRKLICRRGKDGDESVPWSITLQASPSDSYVYQEPHVEGGGTGRVHACGGDRPGKQPVHAGEAAQRSEQEIAHSDRPSTSSVRAYTFRFAD